MIPGCVLMVEVWVFFVTQQSPKDQPERLELLGNAWKGCYLPRSDVFYPVADKCTSVCLGVQLWASAFPFAKSKRWKPSALHEETSAAIKNVTSAACFADTQHTSLSGCVCATICKADRLRQARIATCTEVWIYVRQREKQHSGILGTHL